MQIFYPISLHHIFVHEPYYIRPLFVDVESILSEKTFFFSSRCSTKTGVFLVLSYIYQRFFRELRHKSIFLIKKFTFKDISVSKKKVCDM